MLPVLLALLHVTVSLGGDKNLVTAIPSNEENYKLDLSYRDAIGGKDETVFPTADRASPHNSMHKNGFQSDIMYSDEFLSFKSTEPPSEYGKAMSHVPAGGNDSLVTTKKKTSRKQFCSRSYAFLDNCLSRIPPVPDIGIPATPQAVDTACHAFNMGMTCVDEWTRKCLHKDKIAKFKASISGAHETFAFLCQDQKFRREFLKHSDCFKRVSLKWDDCSKSFIESMKKFHAANNTFQCCIRIHFLQCVSKISHYHCNLEAATFLQKMAETLIRATMRNHIPPQCVSIQRRNCPDVSVATSSFHFFSTPASAMGMVVVSLWRTFIYY